MLNIILSYLFPDFNLKRLGNIIAALVAVFILLLSVASYFTGLLSLMPWLLELLGLDNLSLHSDEAVATYQDTSGSLRRTHLFILNFYLEFL